MDNQYQMTVKGIKRIFKQELESHYREAMSQIKYGDTPRAFIQFGYDAAISQVDNAQTYEDLDTVIGEWYRMSLQEWIESL